MKKIFFLSIIIFFKFSIINSNELNNLEKMLISEVKLSCISEDKSLIENVEIFSFKSKNKIKSFVGRVNGMVGKAEITDAKYTIETEISASNPVAKVVHSIDRTRGIKEQFYIVGGKLKKTIKSNCKLVRPKI